MRSEATQENQAMTIVPATANSEGTTPLNLPTVPKHLAGKGLGIDYSISLARKQPSIGKMLALPEFEADSFLDSLGKVLYQAIGDLGIKTLPDEAGETRITHYIVNYYKDFTIQDIRMAFELAIVGELNVEIEHYNSFDLKYICKILNVYRVRRNRALAAIEKQNKQAEQEPEITEERKQQIRNEFILAVCEQYQRYCDTGDLGFMPRNIIYSLLEEKGLLKLTEDQHQELQEQAIQQFKKKLTKPINQSERNSFQAILKDFEAAIKGPQQNNIEELTKELAIRAFFNQLKSQNTDLKSLLI